MANDVISALQQAGVALGAAPYGTAATSFARGLIVSSFTSNPAAQSVERVPEVRGTLGINRVTKGPLDYEVSLGFPLDVSTNNAAGLGDFLAALMGTDTGTVAAGVYTHKFTVSESSTPAYLNLYSTKDYVAKQVQGFRPTQIKVSLKSGDGFVPVEVSGKAQTESDLAAAQTLTFPAAPLIVPSNVTAMSVGGLAVTNFDTCDITLKNEQEAFRPLSSSRNVGEVYRKAWSVEIALSGLNFASETQRTAYKDVTSSAFLLTLTDSGAKTITFAFPETYITAFEGPNVSDQDMLKINMTMMATGTLANQYVELKNTYTKRYDTGASIV